MVADMQVPILLGKGSYLTRSEAKALGAKNLLPYAYKDGASKTSDNSTFTVNDDGSITIVVSATMTVSTNFYLNDYNTTPADYMDGTYLISKGDSSGSNIVLKYGDMLASESNWSNIFTCEDSNSVLVTPRSNAVKQVFYIQVASGTPAGTYTVYPMIRVSSDLDPTYTPPALSNRILSKEISKITDGNATLRIVAATTTDTVAANTYKTISFGAAESISGYTFVFAIYATNNQSNSVLPVSVCNTNASNITFSMRNIATTSATATFTCYQVYYKNV